MKLIILALLLTLFGCGAENSTNIKLDEIDESARDLVQGCSWRAEHTDIDGWTPDSCYNVYTGTYARVTNFELHNLCDAPKLPSPFQLVPENPEVWGYYNREHMTAFKTLRLERIPCSGVTN